MSARTFKPPLEIGTAIPDLTVHVKHAERSRTQTRTRLVADVEVWNGKIVAGGTVDLQDDKQRQNLANRTAEGLEMPEDQPYADRDSWEAHTRKVMQQALLETLAVTDQHVPEYTPTVGDPDGFAYNDVGNGRLLIARHGPNLHYNTDADQWLVWSGRLWQAERVQAEALSKETLDAQYARLPQMAGSESKELFRHLRASGSAQRIAGMLTMARSEPGIALPSAALDAQPWLLNVGNGTLDLRSATLRDPSRSDLITRGIATNYDPNARAPLFMGFLERIQPHAHLRAFLQRAVGYTLTGDVSERVLFLLHGGGSNGKSTLLDLLGDLLENYATVIRPETIMVKRYAEGIPNDIAALRDKRLVATSELQAEHRLDEPLVKRLTGGGEQLSARHMRAEWFTFPPRFKLWLASNHRPSIGGTDQAVWDRLLLLPFDVSIPPDERDRGLIVKLRGEKAGILAWAVDGCRLWQREGLQPPSEVTSAVASYRQEQDWFAAFLAEHFILGPLRSTPSQDLYAAYCSWCEADGGKPITQTALGRLLGERGFERRQLAHRVWWFGLGLLGAES